MLVIFLLSGCVSPPTSTTVSATGTPPSTTSAPTTTSPGTTPTYPRSLTALQGDLHLYGETHGDEAGGSVAVVGDLDQDGNDDLAVVARKNERAGFVAGTAYVLFGPVYGDVDLSTADAFLTGDVAGDLVSEVAPAGDVDGDGAADFLVAALADEGTAYLISGASLASGSLGGVAQAVIEPPPGATSLGTTLSGAGDVNGDGYDDVLVGDVYGSVWLFEGPLSGSIDTSTAAARIASQPPGQLRSAVSPGDTDGDGLADLLIGIWSESTDFGTRSTTRLWLGPLTGDLPIGTEDAFVLGEDSYVDIAAVGDVDGDGFADALLGASGDDRAHGEAGGAYLFLGPISGDLDYDDADGAYQGTADYENAGWSVSGPGDVNGDGAPDLLIGANQNNEGLGIAYVVLSPRLGTHDLGTADVILSGEPDVDVLSVTGAGGDLDGDGLDDFLVGASRSDFNGGESGSIIGLYGVP